MDNQGKQSEAQNFDGYAVTFQPARKKDGRWQTQIANGGWSNCEKPLYFVARGKLDEFTATLSPPN